jgi:hypothetical protein
MTAGRCLQITSFKTASSSFPQLHPAVTFLTSQKIKFPFVMKVFGAGFWALHILFWVPAFMILEC